MRRATIIVLTSFLLSFVFFSSQSFCEPALSLDYTKDAYLNFVYPDEEFPFGLTYRKVDYYINVVDLYNRYSFEIEDYKEADAGLKKLLEWSRGATLHNTIIRYDMPNEIALDTFCIIGALYNDTEAAGQTLSYLTEDLNIMVDDYYGEGQWGNIADESWAVILIKKTGIDNDIAERLLRIKLKEGKEFLANATYPFINKAAVTIHELLMLKEFDGYKQEKDFWIHQGLSYLEDEQIKGNNLFMANLLDALLFLDVPKQKLVPYIALLKERKREGGYWLPMEGVEPGNGHIFTTPRVLIALEHFKACK